MKNLLINLRRAVADYMQSEGCGCCADHDAHKEHKAILAKLLAVDEYQEWPGHYDFTKYRTEAI